MWPFRRRRSEQPLAVRGPARTAAPRVRRSLIQLVCQAARAEHPNEFGGMLRVEKGVVTELLLAPGTVSGPTHATFQFHMLPIDFSVVGTVHSHPGSVPLPSGADLDLFRRYGKFHIIIAEPYTERTWRAYDGRGDPVRVEVVD